MASRWLWGGVGLAIAGILSGSVLLWEYTKQPILNEPILQTEPPATTVTTVHQPQMAALTTATGSTTTAPPSYLLKLEGSNLVVYQTGIQAPLQSIPITVEWLPDYDRILLEYGIRVQGTSDLRQLLEDYTS